MPKTFHLVEQPAKMNNVSHVLFAKQNCYYVSKINPMRSIYQYQAKYRMCKNEAALVYS